jgi:hypothetical protein
MRRILSSFALLCIIAVSSCATPYKGAEFSGAEGYSEAELQQGIWRASFHANSDTTYETAQTYWLYRCAELTLEQGFDGLEVIDHILLVDENGLSASPIQIAAATGLVPYINFWEAPQSASDGSLTAEIRLLKKPIRLVPAKLLDAHDLKAALEPFVRGKKCASRNVCPHIHGYLHPAYTAP